MKIIQTRAQAYMKANPTETRLGVTNGRYSFRKNITSQSDFQLNKAMNMRCRSPEQHRRKGTTNSHTGNSTSTSLCTTSSPSLSSVCRRGGEGEGALWFPVLWVILPHPAPVVPCLVVPCAPAPPPLATSLGPRDETYTPWFSVRGMGECPTRTTVAPIPHSLFRTRAYWNMWGFELNVPNHKPLKSFRIQSPVAKIVGPAPSCPIRNYPIPS